MEDDEADGRLAFQQHEWGVGMSSIKPAVHVSLPRRGPAEWKPIPPELSAIRTTTLRQNLILLCILVGCVAVCCTNRLESVANIVNDAILAFYGLILVHRAGVLSAGLIQPRHARIPLLPSNSPLAVEVELPTISVMVPLYKEAAVIDQLRVGLKRMEYPAHKVEVLLLLEEDDADTRAACEEADLPSYFRVVVVPPGKPRTKPRACNYGLSFCQGEIIVIFDAEDKPDPDQFMKAAQALLSCGSEVACVQARLAFYNPRQNVLTRLFAAEYMSWFGIMLPGLHSIGAPIPLGGTSNYFRADTLREVGGWDSWNVAEDCDLGMRLYRSGYRVQMLDSTTWEEACPDLRFWIRQRSRWVKGYLQTWLVHTRRPILLLTEMGAWGSANMHMVVGGTVACLLLNPVYWALTILWWVHPTVLEENVMSGPVLILGNLSLILGNSMFIAFHCAGAARRKQWDLIGIALLVPFYWILMSVAAWKAFYQILFAPHHWEKTRHGLAGPQTDISPTEPPAP